jgi:hypothetical protein
MILGKALQVTFDGFVQIADRDAKERCQSCVEQHFLASKVHDLGMTPLIGMAAFSTALLICMILAFDVPNWNLKKGSFRITFAVVLGTGASSPDLF